MQLRSAKLLVALLLVSGCASDSAQRRPPTTQPRARLTLLAAPPAAETARALGKKPYLELTVKDPIKLLEARAREADEPLAAARAAANKALQQARIDYRTFKFSEGVTRLSQAQNRLATAATAAEDFKLLARLALQRGLCQLALKIESEADEAFATALLLGHEGPGQGELPPEVEAQIKRVQQQLSSATTGGITIKARPSGARIWIDGRELGTTPVTVQQPPGLHHVRVTRIGHQPRAFFQRVTSGRMERLEIYLRPAPAPQVASQLLEAKGSGRSLEQEIEALRRVLGKDLLLLTVAGAGKSLEARLTGTRSKAERCSGATPARLSDCLGPMLYRLESGRPYRPHDPGTEKVATTPVYRRWWFWTLLVAGVAGATGAGTGIYFATRPAPGTNIDLELAK